ncbi:hypothetical protein [Evansella cellulosilytica]|uniref:Uncharacterized protein n=1 Tax=Evansella cellulosilytica (strain ATCC 21833 / DSM 2522 / FERM P-1141 / JCM 9156 / N-4) TaxID=649639 RepID=E6TVN8_EVAC2|nr:hypothetical protein [Evansella cellulosilytica]ADU32166.1 hypothetical protein Bcell_3931 [Evansella cellulosilytica DSM 2522]
MVNIKVNNYYYLTVGILAILFAITHAWNGHSVVLPNLHVDGVSVDTLTIFTYVWHIITAENLVFGFVFIFMSFYTDGTKTRITAWVIATILLVRLMVILSITVLLDRTALSDTLIDSIAIIVYVTLIILGTRMKKKQ